MTALTDPLAEGAIQAVLAAGGAADRSRRRRAGLCWPLTGGSAARCKQF